MNKCFFIGNVIEVEKFKFILDPEVEHKSKIAMKIKLLDGNIVKVVAYDEKADYILRNDFYENLVFIHGKLRCESKEIQAVIYYIEKVKDINSFLKNTYDEMDLKNVYEKT